MQGTDDKADEYEEETTLVRVNLVHEGAAVQSTTFPLMSEERRELDLSEEKSTASQQHDGYSHISTQFHSQRAFRMLTTSFQENSLAALLTEEQQAQPLQNLLSRFLQQEDEKISLSTSHENALSPRPFAAGMSALLLHQQREIVQQPSSCSIMAGGGSSSVAGAIDNTNESTTVVSSCHAPPPTGHHQAVDHSALPFPSFSVAKLRSDHAMLNSGVVFPHSSLSTTSTTPAQNIFQDLPSFSQHSDPSATVGEKDSFLRQKSNRASVVKPSWASIYKCSNKSQFSGVRPVAFQESDGSPHHKMSALLSTQSGAMKSTEGEHDGDAKESNRKRISSRDLDEQFLQTKLRKAETHRISNVQRQASATSELSRTALEASTSNDQLMFEGAKGEHASAGKETSAIKFSMEEDCNWLSEFQCFLRAEVLELFRASHEVHQKQLFNRSLLSDQIGLRCRFCVNHDTASRGLRSFAFPSSISKIYQSFTMMLRDHLSNCSTMPGELRARFLKLKNAKSPSVSGVREYWEYSAKARGLVDSPAGIRLTPESIRATEAMRPFRSDIQESRPPEKCIVAKIDRQEAPEFSYAIISRTQLVSVTPSESIGNRSKLSVGHPGLSCVYCFRAGRMGMARVFPTKEKSLPGKIDDLFNHFVQCKLFPSSQKNELRQLHQRHIAAMENDFDYKQKVVTFNSTVRRRLVLEPSETISK